MGSPAHSLCAEDMEHLGYPAYVLILLGVWKLLGAVAVLVPRFPRLKEWAYAGMFFNYTGAVASHLAVGDGVQWVAYPLFVTGLVVASWALPVGSWRPGATLSMVCPSWEIPIDKIDMKSI